MTQKTKFTNLPQLKQVAQSRANRYNRPAHVYYNRRLQKYGIRTAATTKSNLPQLKQYEEHCYTLQPQ
jgi:hypothetical protein